MINSLYVPFSFYNGHSFKWFSNYHSMRHFSSVMLQRNFYSKFKIRSLNLKEPFRKIKMIQIARNEYLESRIEVEKIFAATLQIDGKAISAH